MAEEKTFAASLGIEAYTAEELGATGSGTAEAIPEDKKDAFYALLENVKNAAAERIAANAMRAMAGGPAPEIGTRIPGSYEYWDILSLSPIQPIIAPPFINLPHKIVAGGRTVLHLALLFINPNPSPGPGPSARMYFGSRDFRISFNLLNVTTATSGPSFAWTGTFGPLAPTVSVFWWFVNHANPGADPHLFELNVTADCADPAQPLAAFSTQWLDLDSDPGFPVPDPGGLRSLLPLRYLVYQL